MIKQCKQCAAQYEITQEDLDFYDKVSPEFNWKKYQLQNPLCCPTCRQQRRLVFRNERKLYKRKCNATWKSIISIYSPDSSYIVYSQKEWWSDKWDWINYWIDFDFTKSFFEQFNELFQKVPKMNMIWSNNENSSYCNLVADLKNCYLVFESSNNEDCLYWYWLQKCMKCVDSNYLHECELCYECENCYWCYNSKFLQDCKNCSESLFLKNCISCTNCFWSVNLKNKEFYFLNEKCTKQEYFKKVENLNISQFDNLQNFKKLFAKTVNKYPNKYAQIQKSENCTWDYIEGCNNCIECFHAHDSENCKYSQHVWRNAKYVMDSSTVGRNAQLIYESINCWIDVYSIAFSSQCWNSSNLFYSINCHQISDCFWCIWLKNHKEYCILNKQYTKEEYEILVPKIIEHMKKNHFISSGLSCGQEWWEFFPIGLSPFAYNETAAQEYFPMTKEEVENKSWKWKDQEDQISQVTKTIPADKIPNDIESVPDDIVNWAIKCEKSQRSFKITTQELVFYRNNNIPIPHLHPDIRHAQRISLRNSNELFDRKCDNCDKQIQTTYCSEKSEKVYCENCYLKEIY